MYVFDFKNIFFCVQNASSILKCTLRKIALKYIILRELNMYHLVLKFIFSHLIQFSSKILKLHN